MSIHYNLSFEPLGETHKSSQQAAVAGQNSHIAERQVLGKNDRSIEINLKGNTAHHFSLLVGMPGFIDSVSGRTLQMGGVFYSDKSEIWL